LSWGETAFANVYADLAEMEDILRQSGLDWTVVRPPRLTGRPLTGIYRTAYGQRPWPARHDPRQSNGMAS
jgi:uncharacterized protein YbjT (DUF2867 family)